jgi:hypothetical protein
VVAVRDADHAVEVELDGVGDGTAEVGSLAGGLVGSPEVGSLAGGLVGSPQNSQPANQPTSASQPANQQTSQPPPANQPTSQPPKRLVGETALLGNARHSTSYTITGAQGGAGVSPAGQGGAGVSPAGRPEENGRLVVTFGPESFRLGRFRIGTVAPDGRSLATPTYLYLAAQGYYRGTRLVDVAQQLWLEVDDVTLSPHQPGQRREGRITLREPARMDLAERLGEVAFLYDFGPGDRFTVIPHAHALRQPDGTWAVRGCGQWELS